MTNLAQHFKIFFVWCDFGPNFTTLALYKMTIPLVRYMLYATHLVLPLMYFVCLNCDVCHVLLHLI